MAREIPVSMHVAHSIWLVMHVIEVVHPGIQSAHIRLISGEEYEVADAAIDLRHSLSQRLGPWA